VTTSPASDSRSLLGVTVAFDLDGTLVDTAPDLIGALNAVLAERGLPPVPLAAARHLVGRGARVLIERGFADAGLSLSAEETPALTARFLEIYRDRIADESRPFESVEPALDRLAQAGARLCVCTNKPTELSVLLLERLGLASRFSGVVGADSVPARKPDPGHFLAAVQAAGGDPARAVMVGDSPPDVAAARGAGAPVIVVPFGYTETPAAALGADRLIETFDALFDAVIALAPGPR
jgi:phosphoglycolate phosphatase